ncbi:MAG TPA: TIGR03668 family PPOX class F420-dependent oxidoreductase [Actinomycetes bacterium]|nr:TIGR03668 family PPOX class F420-dependent oxidoreductase [Actinomycetes bacterium]
MPSGRAGPEGPPAQVLTRFAAARLARLATAPAGRPRLVPVTFAWHQGRVVWAVDEVKPKRGRDLRRTRDIEANPQVALLVDHYDEDWTQLWWVELRGSASVLEGAAVEPALDALAARYPAYRSARPAGPVVAIAPDRWAWWSAR